MGIFRVIFELFVFYLLYKLVFDFIIPVYNTTKQAKKQFGDMQQNMQERMKNQQEQQYSNKSAATPPRSSKNDDYIDYEEIK